MFINRVPLPPPDLVPSSNFFLVIICGKSESPQRVRGSPYLKNQSFKIRRFQSFKFLNWTSELHFCKMRGGTHISQTINIRNSQLSKRNTFETWFVFSWIIWSVLVSKNNSMVLGAPGRVQKSRNHRNDGLSVSPIRKSESYQSKMKQHNTTELLSISFP